MLNIFDLIENSEDIIVMSNGCGSKRSSGAKDAGRCGSNGNCQSC